MGCGATQKMFKVKRNEIEEGDTSLQDINIHHNSSITEQKVKRQENGQFLYNVNGMAYKIIISCIKSPELSQVLS
ncbi:unnamed protein product [Blepharisma stoltei]|uniref:Uncharacterized protein n=1 Tax=Blepharisma stoltei TaxID=1481888 RepID=A0AAU9IKF1_9CILI|nr:unnamed protein product [Blepharisma stoltei]